MKPTYERNGKISNPQMDPVAEEKNEEEELIKVDGMQQVLEMLKIADDRFRESLLNRLAKRDPDLAIRLRKELSD